MNRMEFVEFWKIIPVFAQGKELILNPRNLEVGKEQCTSYCIFRSSREGYWRMLKKKMDFFWTIVPVFEFQQIGFYEIREGCSSFRTEKKSYNSTLKFVNFMCSSGLGYCIKEVEGRKATG